MTSLYGAAYSGRGFFPTCLTKINSEKKLKNRTFTNFDYLFYVVVVVVVPSVGFFCFVCVVVVVFVCLFYFNILVVFL